MSIKKLKSKKPAGEIGLEEKLAIAQETNRKLMAEVLSLSELVNQRNGENSLLLQRLENSYHDLINRSTGEVVPALFTPAGATMSWGEIKSIAEQLVDGQLTLVERVLVASFLIQEGKRV